MTSARKRLGSQKRQLNSFGPKRRRRSPSCLQLSMSVSQCWSHVFWGRKRQLKAMGPRRKIANNTSRTRVVLPLFSSPEQSCAGLTGAAVWPVGKPEPISMDYSTDVSHCCIGVSGLQRRCWRRAASASLRLVMKGRAMKVAALSAKTCAQERVDGPWMVVVLDLARRSPLIVLDEAIVVGFGSAARPKKRRRISEVELFKITCV